MMKRILVVRFGSLGDVILTSATVLNLSFSFPHARIVYLTKERFRDVVSQFDGVDEIITLPEDAGAAVLIRTSLRLDNYGFDAVVDLHGNMRSWLTRKLVSAGNTVMYPKRRLERVRAVKYKEIPSEYSHTVDSYNAVLTDLGGHADCRRPVMRPCEDDAASFDGDLPKIIIAPGAAHVTKQWPLERFVTVARRLGELHDAHICWAVTSEDHAKLQNIATDLLCDDNCLVNLPIPKLAAVIANANLTIANDSGISHLSSAVGTPTLALFGPTHPVLGFAPQGLHDRVIQVDEFCRPCSLHGQKACYRDRRHCFERIDSDTVIAAASEVLAEREHDQPAWIVDRDGTIIENKHYLSDPEGVELLPGAAAALRSAQDKGYKLVIVSNQSGVARGLHTIADVERVNRRLLELLAVEKVTIDGLYYCPHHPTGSILEYAAVCDCRKPAPGMIEAAVEDLGINPRRSVVIGDSSVDINLGRAIGARSVLVRTGYGRDVEQEYADSGWLGDVTVCDSLGDTANVDP